MIPGLMVVGLGAVLLAFVLIAIEATLRNAAPEPRNTPFDRSPGNAGDNRSPATGAANTAPRCEGRIVTLFEANELLALDHLRGMDAADLILRRLTEHCRTEERSPQRRPRRPTSILLHGPPGGATTILVHELARDLRARLVHLFATKSLPTTNGGVQPKVAAIVNQARDHLPSLLMIDELEYVAASSVRGAEQLRTANDLLAEALRPMYGSSHVVVAVFTAYGDRQLTRRVVEAFDHAVEVDLPELERALRCYTLRTGDQAVFRAISGPRLAEHPDILPPPRHSAA